MSTSQYLLGVAELVTIVSALGLGAYHVRALIVPAWTGALARLAEIVLGLSALIVIAELLGLLKLLEEVPLVAASVLVGLGAAWFARHSGEPDEHEAPAVKPSRAMMAVAILASIAIVAHWAEPSQEAMDTGMYLQDSTWYHMSFSGRFAQTGEVGPLHFTDPLKLVAWFYPQNAELLHAIGMVAMDTDFLSTLYNLAWLSLCLLAAWCIGRPYAVGAVTLLGAGVVVDSEMLFKTQAGQAPNDIAGIFFLLAVLAFLVNGAATARAAPRAAGAGDVEPRVGKDEFDPAADEDHPQEGVVTEVPVAGDPRALAGVGAGPLILGGLAAGLGIGTKITLLAALGALTIGIVILAGRREWPKALGIWLGAMIVTSGFWYGRNIVHAVNPFPQIDKLGPIDLPGPEQGDFYPRQPHSLSEYANDPGIWQDFFFPVLNDRLGPLWPAVLAAVVAALVVTFVWGGSRLLKMLAATGAVAGIAYVFTPLTASGGLGEPTGFDSNLRYIGPAMIIALSIVPLAAPLRRGKGPWILLAIFGALILQGSIESQWDYAHTDESLLTALLIVGVPAILVAAGRAGVRRWALVGIAAAALAVIVTLGRVQKDQYIEDRYRSEFAPYIETGFRAKPEWRPIQDFGKETRDARIGVVGRASAFGQYFFYGDDLSNHVQYLGNELRRGTYRQIARCDDLREVINEGDYDYVIVTPRIRREDANPPENLWVGADRATRAVVRSGPAKIFAVDGKLNPRACRKLGPESSS